MNDIIKTRIGPYEIVDRLGQGGMGVVHRARHVSLRREVALKVLRGRDLDDTSAVQRFLREMSAAAKFQHPNLVRVYDGGIDDGLPYLAMELVRGRSLEQMLKNGRRLAWEPALAIAAQLFDGLGYLHERGIIHRDIKLANVLLSDEGVVKLCDFGLENVDQTLELVPARALLPAIDFLSYAPDDARSWFELASVLEHCGDATERRTAYAVACRLMGETLIPAGTPNLWRSVVRSGWFETPAGARALHQGKNIDLIVESCAAVPDLRERLEARMRTLGLSRSSSSVRATQPATQ